MVIEIPTRANQVPDLKQRDVREGVTKGRVKTSYVSLSPAAFIPAEPDVDDVTYDPDDLTSNAENKSFFASVNIPQGATLTKCIVYGNAAATAESFAFIRVHHDGTGDEIVSAANIGTEANTNVIYSIINNQEYSYQLWITLDTNDKIYGARITYTTEYI